MNVLKKKLYFTTLIKMGASFIFVVFTFAIIIATGALKDMGSYFKGFKAEKINSVSDLMKVTKFNTKIIEVKDIYPLKGKDYNKPGQVSEPEWGISFSKKAKDAMETYRFSLIISTL